MSNPEEKKTSVAIERYKFNQLLQQIFDAAHGSREVGKLILESGFANSKTTRYIMEEGNQ